MRLFGRKRKKIHKRHKKMEKHNRREKKPLRVRRRHKEDHVHSSLEKKLSSLENNLKQKIDKDRKMFRDVDSSFTTFKDIVKNLHEENAELKHDRDFLIEREKEKIRKIPVKKDKLKKDVKEMVHERGEDFKEEYAEGPEPTEEHVFHDRNRGKILRVSEDVPKSRSIKKNVVEPIKQRVKEEIKEDRELVEQIVTNKPAKDVKKIKTTIDELFELVMKTGKVKIQDVARKFNVHEIQVEEWAKILEEHDLIDIHYPAVGKPELRKKGFVKKEKKNKKKK